MMKSKLSKSIFELRDKGYSYNQICLKLNCSKSIVSYHCGNGQKNKTLIRNSEYRQKNVILKKIHRFHQSYKTKSALELYSNKTIKYKLFSKIRKFGDNKPMFTVEDLLNKIGSNPTCYLTGLPIDLNDSKSYQLDHKIPKSRGGDNSLENCGLVSKRANMSKSDMTYEEYIELCKLVISNHEKLIAHAGNAPASRP